MTLVGQFAPLWAGDFNEGSSKDHVGQARVNLSVNIFQNGEIYDILNYQQQLCLSAPVVAYLVILQGFFAVSVMKLTAGRLVNGLSYDGIDMVIKDLDLEPKVNVMMRD
nr:hypothetical protein [Tanacetum cinerariifolium]